MSLDSETAEAGFGRKEDVRVCVGYSSCIMQENRGIRTILVVLVPASQE